MAAKNASVSYFNKVTSELFEMISDVKYTLDLIELNEDDNFIGVSIRTDQASINLTILLPTNFNHFKNKNCSIAFYDLEDVEMLTPFDVIPSTSLKKVCNSIRDQIISETLITPLIYQN